MISEEMSVLGINIAKRVFHAMGMDERGKVVLRKRLSRHALMTFIATLPVDTHVGLFLALDGEHAYQHDQHSG